MNFLPSLGVSRLKEVLGPRQSVEESGAADYEDMSEGLLRTVSLEMVRRASGVVGGATELGKSVAHKVVDLPSRAMGHLAPRTRAFLLSGLEGGYRAFL